uniref:Uncharacterized protein n=1 Tax=Medicago truncatula TaxID=3880 RepID=Q2HSW4_MEDTR|nr:hypothetical protein MtrDRAFT_AC150891g12v2 [Medicago truncatula]
MELYKQHRNTSSFERISLYFGWLNYGPRMALDEVVVEEQGDYRWLNMNMRFGRIKNHVLSIIGSGVVV